MTVNTCQCFRCLIFSPSIQLSVSTSFCFKTLTAGLPRLPHLCSQSEWSKIFLDSQGAATWSIALCPFPRSLIASYQQNPPSSLITSLALFLTDLFLPVPALINRAYSSFPRHSGTPRPAMRQVQHIPGHMKRTQFCWYKFLHLNFFRFLLPFCVCVCVFLKHF